jgi:RNA polymerase II subunit A small phosphatase-like protein
VPLLKPIKDEFKGRKTLILDVDETLVHSSFKPPPNPNIIIPIDIEGRICNIFILVRPHAVEFINEMSKYFELAIFTASLSKYADPLMNILDSNNHAP